MSAGEAMNVKDARGILHAKEKKEAHVVLGDGQTGEVAAGGVAWLGLRYCCFNDVFMLCMHVLTHFCSLCMFQRAPPGAGPLRSRH